MHVWHSCMVPPTRDHGIGDSALDVLIDGQVQVGQQFDLADQNQV